MADETQAAVLDRAPVEASPTGESSPAGGLGANDSGNVEQATARDRQAEAYQKLQSEHDKAKSRAEKAERRLHELASQREIDEALARAPDPSLYPDQHSDYLQRTTAHFAAKAKSKDQIYGRLAQLARDTGVVVEINDSRLDLTTSGEVGWKKFTDSVQRIKDEITAEARAKESEKELRERLKQELKDEVLRDAGVDTFDRGSSSGGGTLTTASYLAMDFESRRKLKSTAEGRAQIDRALARR